MDILVLLLFLIPIYIANSAPVILGGGKALDLGTNFLDGRRILGNGKTIRGFIGGVLAGTVFGGFVALAYQLPFFTGPFEQFIAAFIVSLGTMTGDSLGSFLKRRLNIESGKPFWPDTILFLIVALLFAFPFVNSALYQPFNVIFFLMLTIVMHPLTNALANKFGLKKVPW
ncbi:CDP-2,3-bis-(O-geranylgeranyl)-sn-glycerol synthase [Candidatus Micrarchaeota archaeon]|nr:CDP-2,3-bis-(O-geranylgeranyl)-sn-glycerol synthase [Candidatus Micrarchaeota archaeon]